MRNRIERKTDAGKRSVVFVGGFNDSGGGRYSVANFAREAAYLNPHVAVQFFSWRERRAASDWIKVRQDSPVVVGQSLGGYVAARVAIANPGKIGALITVDPVSPASLMWPLDFTWQAVRDS